MSQENILLLSDAYKVSHHNLYPPKTQKIYSYFESRGGQWPHSVFFGLQYILQKYLVGPVVTKEKIDEAASMFESVFNSTTVFNRSGWEYILREHGGRLPVVIRAVPEGSIIKNSNCLMTVVNTDDKCAWLTNYLETLLVQAWYPCTVATQSYEMKKVLLAALEKSGTPSEIDFKMNDFGFRGSTSVESSALGGAAHLVNFKGSDTLSALKLIKDYYYTTGVGGSIPATEHSTITSWGRPYEKDAYENMLRKYPAGIIACVSDSYNIYESCSKLWGDSLRDQVLLRDGVLVIRPDSGDPLVVLPRILEILSEKFGFSINAKGYKVLNPHVRVIQGDGITYVSMVRILNLLMSLGWSIDNICFGSGGGLLQQVNRDTLQFAFKCSAIQLDTKWRDVYKDPIDGAGKRSKRGLVELFQNQTTKEYFTSSYIHMEYATPCLISVFKDGELLHPVDFSQVRGLTNSYFQL